MTGLFRRLRFATGLAAALLVAGCTSGDGGNQQTDIPTDQGTETVSETATDTFVPPTGGVVINEVVNKASGNKPDWVELFNNGDDEVDLEGWFIRDQNDLHKFVFPAGTRIQAKGFLLVFGKGATAPLTMTFAFKSGDAARLFDTTGKLVDQADWEVDAAPEGSSWGRSPNGTGPFTKLSPPTEGTANP